MRDRKGETIKVAIAGLGRSGWGIHAKLLRPLTDKYQIVAVSDNDPARMQEAQDEFNCRTYSSYKKLITDEEAELIVVSTPNKLHAKHSIDAMNAGKHVVCEKPMAAGVKDADRMIAVAKKTEKKLAVFQNRRYFPDYLTVKKVIDSGVLGRIVQIKISTHAFNRRRDWQSLKKLGGGTLNNMGPHMLDHALTLFGSKKPKILCLRDKALTLGDADDHVKIILHAKNCPIVEVEMTSACAYPQDNWLVMGTQGGLAGSFSELHWKYFDPNKLPKQVVDPRPTPDRSYNTEDLKFTEKTWKIEDDKGPGATGFYMDLYQSIRNDKPLTITTESVRRQLWALQECRKMAPI